ncbi:protein spinster isoform X5 [Bombyx mandarina]|uniref:Protein spinster isoform X5 n=1 Tax=Bombyx mandarina TaxID=7092 RepID=A0A6J2KP85_BOMMA|nr:protein spinster isoform X5 [Bombyx mandarina]
MPRYVIEHTPTLKVNGVLNNVKTEFEIGDGKAGFLQTVFVVAYMLFAPIFGYLGDRYSRRVIMASGVALWSLTTFFGSFLHDYESFAFFRGLVGIGEASYSTIAPTIISDLFVGDVRSKMLAFFYFAIPVGSGLGYIVGSVVGAALGNWRYGLRVTPFFGAIAVALIIWVMEDPERGASEESHIKPTSYKDDLRALIKNPSFMLSTIAFTCVAFVTGALTWWGPQVIYLGLGLQPGNEFSFESVSYKFGLVGMAAGALGVPLGCAAAARARPLVADADPLLCGAALLLSAPLVFCALIAVRASAAGTFALIFFGMLTLNLTWSVVADMILGFANVRRDHHGVGHVGRAAGRVAGRGAAEAVGPRAPAAVRRGAAAVGAGGRARLASDRGLHVRPFRPHIYRRARDQYQLGNRGRHVAVRCHTTKAFDSRSFPDINIAHVWGCWKSILSRSYIRKFEVLLDAITG